MTKTTNRPGGFSLIAGLLSAGLLLVVAVGALRMPGYQEAPAALVIGAGVLMLGAVLFGLIAVILGLVGLFQPAKKTLALTGAIVGGASVAFLVLLVVIGERVGGGRVPPAPALRPDTSAR